MPLARDVPTSFFDRTGTGAATDQTRTAPRGPHRKAVQTATVAKYTEKAANGSRHQAKKPAVRNEAARRPWLWPDREAGPPRMTPDRTPGEVANTPWPAPPAGSLFHPDLWPSAADLHPETLAKKWPRSPTAAATSGQEVAKMGLGLSVKFTVSPWLLVAHPSGVEPETF